jgi:hypothetical protein
MILWEEFKTGPPSVWIRLEYLEDEDDYEITLEINNKLMESVSFQAGESPSKRYTHCFEYTYDMHIRDLEKFCKEVNNLLKKYKIKLES